jgi:hypothetical protein
MATLQSGIPISENSAARAAPQTHHLTERQQFADLQRRLPGIFQRLFPDPAAPQTIVVVPSMTLDEGELPKLAGAGRYEERLLCLLMLLRRPGIRIVYLSSRQISPAIIDYYLGLLPGVPQVEARRRLALFDCHDDSPVPLTRKLLERPQLIERIRAAIPDPDTAHMTCFNTTPLERALAVLLGIPLYGCDPDLLHLGSKSGSRRVLKRAGVPVPFGCESLRDIDDVADALYMLRRSDPTLARALVKLDEGFSGAGNAVFSFDGAPTGASLQQWITAQLPSRLRYVAADETWPSFSTKLERMGGVVEEFVEGGDARSPSVQCRIDPLGTGRIISTHDQLLGGADGQVYQGCSFPADAAYARDLHDAGMRVTNVLRQEGVLGRFGIDFISHRRNGRWQHTALEINLRKGGTTHPFLTLQFLTGGDYCSETAEYRTASGATRCYRASDNYHIHARLCQPRHLIHEALHSGLHFDPATEQGVMFHLLGALPEHGKFGAICIAETHREAQRLDAATRALADRLRHRDRTPRRGRSHATQVHGQRL